MLYLYDRAICQDLSRSFDPDMMGTSAVKVVDPEASVDVVSQIRNDDFPLPAVIVTRGQDYDVDTSRLNFTRLHMGVSTVIDKETNNIYNEKAMPIILRYNITVLTSNTADMDELTRELLFKYSDMYFLKINLPYESDRSMRFGVRIDYDQSIEQTSRQLEYIQNGQMYQTIIHLVCDGCVLLTYTPHKLHRYVEEKEIGIPNEKSG